MSILRSVAAGIVGMLLVACTPVDFSTSLSEPGEVPYDPRVVGIWQTTIQRDATFRWSTDDDSLGSGTYHLHIRPDNDGQLKITVIAYGEGEDYVYWLIAAAHVSKVNEKIYYNVRRVPGRGNDYTGEGRSPGYMIWRAEIDAEDQLFLRTLNVAFYADPEAEAWIGSVEREHVECPNAESLCDKGYAWIDITRDELRQLIRTAPESRWVSSATFKRVEPVPQ